MNKNHCIITYYCDQSSPLWKAYFDTYEVYDSNEICTLGMTEKEAVCNLLDMLEDKEML